MISVGFLFIPMLFSLIPQHCPPLWYVCCVPAHLNTFLRSYQPQDRSFSGTIWELCLLRILFQWGYDSPGFPLLSVCDVFLPMLQPESLSFLSTQSLGTCRTLLVCDCSMSQPLGATSCNYPHNHHSTKHCWTTLISSSSVVTAHRFIRYLLLAYFLSPIFGPLQFNFDSRGVNKRLLCL